MLRGLERSVGERQADSDLEFYIRWQPASEPNNQMLIGRNSCDQLQLFGRIRRRRHTKKVKIEALKSPQPPHRQFTSVYQPKSWSLTSPLNPRLESTLTGRWNCLLWDRSEKPRNARNPRNFRLGPIFKLVTPFGKCYMTDSVTCP